MANISKVELKNLDKLKLLITSKEFQKITEDFREKFNIPEGGFGGGNYIPKKWLLGIAKNPVDAYEILTKEIEQILKNKKLPTHFFKSIWKYLINGEIYPLSANFSLRVSPVVEMDKTGKIKRYADEIQLITYAPMNTKEWSFAIKQIKRWQKLFFKPGIAKETRFTGKDINFKYEVEEDMKSRTKYHKEIQYDGYLAILKKEQEKGKISKIAFREAEKSNPHEVKIVKTGKTSKDIAKKKGKKANTIRKSNSRLKKKRKIFE